MPRGRKKIDWSPGDLFTVRLKDNSRVIGQVLDLMMPNIVSVAFADIRLDDDSSTVDPSSFSRERAFATLSTWRDPLDSGHWPIVGHKPFVLQRREWPNEQYRSNDWIGAKHYNTALVEAFLNAYYGLAPWDTWYDPLFFDRLLFDGTKRPPNVILTKAQNGSVGP